MIFGPLFDSFFIHFSICSKTLPETIFGRSKRQSMHNLLIKIHIRLRACRRPSLFSPAKSLRHQTFEALMSFLQGADPLGGPRGGAKGTQGGPQRDPRGSQRTQGDPKGTKGPKGPKGTQGESRGPKGPKGTQGTQGRLRRPLGLWALGVIPEPFRMKTRFERRGYYETTPKLKPWLEKTVERK